MSKGLEALENIKREAGTPYFSTLYDIDMWREDFATIEKELNGYERMLKVFSIKELANTERKLKALEIIKEKILVISDFDVVETKETISLTYEECNLLKEVLL